MLSQKRILISPLNWGLGHATRCIPIIRLLIKKNAKVVVAADGRPLELLQQEFPDLEFIRLKGYDITYTAGNSLISKMILSIPEILKGIYREHQVLKKIILEKKIPVKKIVFASTQFAYGDGEYECPHTHKRFYPEV